MASTPDFFTDTSQFDLARRRATQQSSVDLQQRQDALNRRFASLGNLDSGAQLKQNEIAANDVNSQLADTNAGIDTSQQAELARRAGIKQAQDYATSERLGSQAYGTSERLGSQTYGTSERLGSQDFQKKAQEFALGMQANEFNVSLDLANRQFDEAKNQFVQTFGEDQLTNERNYEIAKDSLNKQGVLENTLGGLLPGSGNLASKISDFGKSPIGIASGLGPFSGATTVSIANKIKSLFK